MSILRYFKKIELLDSLIRRKATGSQRDFARKAGMSRALLNIYLNEMKELGFPINFNRSKNTYYYEEDGRLVSSLFERSLSREELQQHKGGSAAMEWMPALMIGGDTWPSEPGFTWPFQFKRKERRGITILDRLR